jgi:hypothetical protein
VSSLRAERPSDKVRPRYKQYILFLNSIQTVSGPHTAFCKMGTEGYTRDDKAEQMQGSINAAVLAQFDPSVQ